MTRYVALLRGINVGGKNKIAMQDLRAMFEAAGMANPRTLLQSGNVVFDSIEPAAALEAKLEADSAKRLGLAVDYFVRDAAHWRAIIQNNPYRQQAGAEPSRLMVTCLKSAPDAGALAALQGAIPGREQLHGEGRELYVYYPDGMGKSKLDAGWIDRKLKLSGTARNWNTVLKIAALLAE